MDIQSAIASARPLVHIGFHKTASTLLQRALFARNDLGFERPHDDRVRIQGDFVRVAPFDPMPATQIAAYRKNARDAASRGNTLVVSHERLSGYPGSGAFDAPLIAQRIKDCLPDARILIFVREQCDLLASYYLQYITDGGSMSFRRLTSPVQPRMYRRPQFDIEMFAFIKTIQHYHNLFGPDNVLVVPFEALHTDGWRVARAIAQYVGQDPERISVDIFDRLANRSMPILMQLARRRLNGFLNRNQLALDAPFALSPFDRWYPRLQWMFDWTRSLEGPLRRRLEHQVRTLVADRFAQSNSVLQQFTHYDLRHMGYRMDADSLSAKAMPKAMPAQTRIVA